MWLFTSKSFLSVVADKENPKGDRLLVRSRIAGDIEEVFPTAQMLWKHLMQIIAFVLGCRAAK